MTMHRIEVMEATMAELDNKTAGEVLRVMVQNVAWIHGLAGPELTTVEEFHVAVDKVPEAERVYHAIRAQSWDREHVDAYMVKHALLPSGQSEEWLRLAEDQESVRHHMNGEGIY